MKLFVSTALALIALLTPAHATLQVSIDVNGFTDFASSPTGTLAVASFTLDGVTVSNALEQSFGTPRTPLGINILNTSSLQLTNNSGATRIIKVTVGDTDFHPPVWVASTAGSGVWVGAGDLSHITMNWFGDPLNQQGASTVNDTPGILLDTFSNTSNGDLNDGFSHNGEGFFVGQLFAPFSFTEQATIVLAAGGSLINRGQSVAAVPEPASWVMMGLGFMALVGLHRRKKELSI